MNESSAENAAILRESLETVTKYIKDNDSGSGIVITREAILEMLQIPEPEEDSAKAIINALEEIPEIRILKEPKNQTRYFYLDGDHSQPIDSWKNPYPNAKFVIHNVMQLSENRYAAYKSAAELQKMWANNDITYNPDVQRGMKTVYKKDGSTEEVPVYSKSNVKQIALKLIEGNYKPDTIVTTVLKDGTDDIIFEDGTLYFISGNHNILNGQHRLHAFDLVEKLKAENGMDVDLGSLLFGLEIYRYTLEEAQDAFYQYTKGLKVSPSRAEFFNSRNYENSIVKALLQKSDLKNKVEIIRNTIDKKDTSKVVTFATLVNAIRMTFPSIQTSEKANAIADYLCKFFDKLVSIVPELHDYEKRTLSKEDSLIAENFTFYGYMAVAGLLYETENWEKNIEQLLNMDYAKNSKHWFNKVVRKGKTGYSITNNADGRSYFINKFKKEFSKLLKREAKEETAE